MIHSRRLEGRWAWIAPASILVTIVITFASAKFHDFYFPAATWEAAFLIAAALTIIWLIRSVARAIFLWTSIDRVIGEIMQAANIGAPAVPKKWWQFWK